MRVRIIALLLLGSLAACSSGPRVATTPPPTPAMPAMGLERVLGRTAAQLVQLFGPPEQDLRERQMRRLQFAAPACVLDAYLYPKGSAEPVVTYLDARLPNGDDFDRASCVAALVRAKGR
jgi:hypothetical protein